MIKNINISTKITLLILLISLVAVSAVSFFTYDNIRKANQEKYLVNLSVIADNRAGYLSSQLDKAVVAIRSLQESEVIKSGNPVSAIAAVAEEPTDIMALTSQDESN